MQAVFTFGMTGMPVLRRNRNDRLRSQGADFFGLMSALAITESEQVQQKSSAR
jgi:hypothetical protein